MSNHTRIPRTRIPRTRIARPRGTPHRLTSGARLLAAGALAAALAGCSLDDILGEANVPDGYKDPASARTPSGALAAYNGALARFRHGYAGRLQGTWSQSAYVLATGVFSDELQPNFLSTINGDLDAGYGVILDRRILPEVTDPRMPSPPDYTNVYSDLQAARGQAREALGLLQRYAPDEPPALRGHLYATIGYAEVFLADFFCSGVPLSTVEFDGNYTLAAGSSTEEVYAHAVAMFDSALVLAADSARIAGMARVGKARALLGMGRVAEAAAAASEVPDAFRYGMKFQDDGTPTGASRSAFYVWATPGTWNVTVANREGLRGADFVTSGDPRTTSIRYRYNTAAQPLYYPRKYATILDTTRLVTRDDSLVVLASGVEARLIQAEAELQAGGTAWLATLNALRTDGTFTTRPNAADSTRTDTLWNRGTGNVPGLRPLEDPLTQGAREDLLFRERAAWLFLTGHRQGDLRRLVRQYGREEQAVYPSGTYMGRGFSYGSDVTAPIPSRERLANPRFTGCLHRGA